MLRLLSLSALVAACALAPALARAEVDEVPGDSTFEATDFARANVFAASEGRELSVVEAFVDCPGVSVELSLWHLTEPLGSTFSRVATASTVGANDDDGWVSADLTSTLEAGETYALGFWSEGPCSYAWGPLSAAPVVAWGEVLGGLARNTLVEAPTEMYGPSQELVYAMRVESVAVPGDDDDAADDDDTSDDDDIADDDDTSDDDDIADDDDSANDEDLAPSCDGCDAGSADGDWLAVGLILLALSGARRPRRRP